MHEIEVKILEIDPGEIEKKILQNGGSKHFEGELHAIFFDFEEGSIGAKGDVLRLRKEGNETVLAYKKHVSKGEAKIMEEYETKISDFSTLRIILKQLGLEGVKQTRKFRTEYLLGQSSLVIDDYQDALSHIPVFLEIESPDLSQLRQIATILGYSEQDCKSWNTYDLIVHYKDLES